MDRHRAHDLDGGPLWLHVTLVVVGISLLLLAVALGVTPPW